MTVRSFVNLTIFCAIILVGFMTMAVSIQAAQVHILCYHTFLGRPKIDTDFSITEFESHIRIIENKGYRFRTFSEIRSGTVTGDRNILLVIDDGNRSAYDATTAVLKPHHIPAMFAIYPGIINTRKFAMTWAQLRELKDSGNEFASHGYFHEFLNQKLKDKRPADFDKEAVLSKKILEKELGIPIDVYIYPFGICTAEGKALLKSSGYKYAMTIRSRVTLLPLSKNPNPLELPRTMMTRATAKSTLATL
jgi:peptidoglycan/xylan/chitin deacetylase (PgdA/CDA1 family)